MALYNTIGTSYDATRCAEPAIVAKLQELIPTKSECLDVGCGSGNYTIPLADMGHTMTGLDPSDSMLAKASIKRPDIKWDKGDAHHLPYADGAFNAVTCVWASHHFQDLEQCYREMYRVLKQGAIYHITAFTDQICHYWLNHYFPQMLASAASRQKSREEVISYLESAGFGNITEYKFVVTSEYKDMSLQGAKHHPRLFLNEDYRNAMSAFRIDCPKEELLDGVDRLSTDIDTGKIQEIISSYDSKEGDFSLIGAFKA